MDIDYFKELKLIGEGNFSEIYKAKCKFRKEYFAIKKFSKYRLK